MRNIFLQFFKKPTGPVEVKFLYPGQRSDSLEFAKPVLKRYSNVREAMRAALKDYRVMAIQFLYTNPKGIQYFTRYFHIGRLVTAEGEPLNAPNGKEKVFVKFRNGATRLVLAGERVHHQTTGKLLFAAKMVHQKLKTKALFTAPNAKALRQVGPSTKTSWFSWFGSPSAQEFVRPLFSLTHRIRSTGGHTPN